MKFKTLAAASLAALIAAGTASYSAGALTTIAASMIPGLAASATVDTTNAGNIGSGTLGAARLPLATSSAPGAVQAGNPTAGQVLTSFTAGVAQYSSIAFTALTGSISGTQIPAPAVTSFTCDGTTVNYTLGATPNAASKISVNIGGVPQLSNAYTFSGTTLTLAAACPNNTPAEARVYP